MSTPDASHGLPVSSPGAPGAPARGRPARPAPYRMGPHKSQPPNAARIYDYPLGYLLGCTDNYAADRAAADRIRAVMPEADAVNPAFYNRAAKWMANRTRSRWPA